MYNKKKLLLSSWVNVGQVFSKHDPNSIFIPYEVQSLPSEQILDLNKIVTTN